MVGVPLAFLLLTAALWVLTVGYVAVARYEGSAAAFYTILANGLGRPVGVAGAAVALVGYNAVQIALYGLIGSTIGGGVGWLVVAVGGRDVGVGRGVWGVAGGHLRLGPRRPPRPPRWR